jgi:hypothetical protein
VPSPSRRFDESPLLPRRAAYGPAAGFQQPRTFRHVRSSAWVVRITLASTVTSCRAEAGVSIELARFAGHASWSAEARTATASTTCEEYAGSMRVAALVLAAALGLCVTGTQARSAAPAFRGAIEQVRWAELRHSYRAGCPVAPAQLRTVHVSYWDFAGKPQLGAVVVARGQAAAIRGVFRKLWDARFPIRRLRPVSEYRGSDEASMAADNTSAFNCRFVGGTRRWSLHAYGEAIDVNPVENPYVRGSTVSPAAGRAFLDRSRQRKGMAVRNGVLVRAFAAAGWKWGAAFGDYQHFSTTGR